MRMKEEEGVIEGDLDHLKIEAEMTKDEERNDIETIIARIKTWKTEK
jgi:DNA helicase TIP49 (TBP-interacting protein)